MIYCCFMEPEERFARIESLLHAMAERENQIDIRFNRRMEQAEKRMDRAEELCKQRNDAAMARMDRAEQRMVKFDRRLAATQKLVLAGMKMLVRNEAQIRELQKSQKAFLDSLRKGGNGSKRAA